VTDSAANGGAPVPYTANAVNQYTAIDSLAVPTHDPNGNLASVQYRLGQPVWSYTYDAQNRLSGGTASNGDTFSFAYDARNRCIARTITVGNQPTTLLLQYDGWRLLIESDPTGTKQARYIHGAGLDELLCRITPTGASYYHQDHLGSTVALTDATGTLTERVTYDAYGLPTLLDPTGTPVPASPSGNRHLFTGREVRPPLPQRPPQPLLRPRDRQVVIERPDRGTRGNQSVWISWKRSNQSN